jgi:hypothetical protein
MGFPELTNHPPEVPNLNESGAHREIDANTNEQIDEDVCVQDIAKRIDQLLLKEVQICSLSETCAAVSHRHRKGEMLTTGFVHRAFVGGIVKIRSQAPRGIAP